MKLTKKQKKIYDWLLSKPGYLKKSAVHLAFENKFSAKVDDYRKALVQANTDYKIKQEDPKLPDQKQITVKSSIKLDPNNVLIIGDTHFPFEREGYLEHLLRSRTDYKCGTIVHIGDVVDNAYSSFHESNPDGHSAGDELSLAIEHLQPYYNHFPKAKVCLGNHDLIINRKAFSNGVSKRWIKGLDEVLGVKGWDFDVEHVIHNVLYVHGTGTSGQNAAYNVALNRRMSVVQGHLHSEANLRYNVSKNDIIFGLQVGCGVDDRKYAFDYAKANPRKFIISCATVQNAGKLPIILPMNL